VIEEPQHPHVVADLIRAQQLHGLRNFMYTTHTCGLPVGSWSYGGFLGTCSNI
jgi:hypothetical protein